MIRSDWKVFDPLWWVTPHSFFTVWRLLVVVVILLFAVCLASAKNYDPWYYQSDRDYRFLMPDKAQHFYGSQLLASKVGVAPALLCGLLWEIGEAGLGQFVSIRDLGADALGIIASQFRAGALYVTWDVEKKEIMLRTGVRL